MANASKIIRAVDTLRKNGDSTIFNDKIVYGRSYKVWGWANADYDAAHTALEAAGYTVKRVQTKGCYRNWRLWVKV